MWNLVHLGLQVLTDPSSNGFQRFDGIVVIIVLLG